jgi:hypothetical protein
MSDQIGMTASVTRAYLPLSAIVSTNTSATARRLLILFGKQLQDYYL